MDKDDLIASLTAELAELRIHVAQIERAVVGGPTPEEIGSRARGVAAEYERSAREAAASTFKKGDRIRIKKHFKKPANWSNAIEWNQDKAQLATVTRITKAQVWFISDQGIETWRAIKNIEKTDNIEE